jgi:hypothetical protein
MQGRPARVLSPWIDRNISVITISLAVPARRFAALVPVNQNHRGNSDEAGHNEAKRLNLVPQPPQN